MEAFQKLADELLLSPEISARKMFGWNCLFVNGNAFAGGSEEGMLFKLDEKALKNALRVRGIEVFNPMGTPGAGMKSWVKASPDTFPWWSRLAADALEFVSALPPKKTASRKAPSPKKAVKGSKTAGKKGK